MILVITLLEPVKLTCDPKELETLLRQCMSTCLADVDSSSLLDCMTKCQDDKNKTDADCDSQKGKLYTIAPAI